MKNLCALTLLVTSLSLSSRVSLSAPFEPKIPRTWEEAEIASFHLPLAEAAARPQHAPADYYYRIPVRPIYKSYPVYHPDREPAGYFADLSRRKPEILWDDKNTRPKLEAEEDWRAAGELVFDAGIIFSPNSLLGPTMGTNLYVRQSKWYEKTGAPTTQDGILPFFRYIIREEGKVEVGVLSCAMCHTRVMPDGNVIKGAQGNFPFGKAFAYEMIDPAIIEPAYRGMLHALYSVPWLKTDPQGQLDILPLKEIASHFEVIPPGVLPRHGTGSWSPVQVPDLIGVQQRQYLDRTGLQRHRGPGDMMRYAALNQGLDMLTAYNGQLLTGQPERVAPERHFEQRYSDEQLYALTLYLYSLKPPKNPNLPASPEQKQLVERGRELFKDSNNRCATCHDPDQGYTNNKLVAAPGFTAAEDHPESKRILRQRVNTDAALTLSTRRGTGFYKVPSLLGTWYRGPFEHNGSCATLEDWFNPERVKESYVPTGWRGPAGSTARPVKGHEYGLDLSEEDRKALIAFLKTL